MRHLHTLALFALLPLGACGEQVVGWPLPDEDAPSVVATTPDDGAEDVALHAPITATFDEAMAPGSIDEGTFQVMAGATPVDGTVVLVGLTAVFEPDASLAPDILYTATIASDVTDLAGNRMANDYVWTFRTVMPTVIVDTTAPTVVATTPRDAAEDVALEAIFTATFSEDMDPDTLDTTTFTVHSGATVVSGDVTFAGRTAFFEPDAPLLPNTSYTALITTGAEDLAGNGLAQDFGWTVTTGVLVDTTAPRVTQVMPDDRATVVALGTLVTATFSEVMDPLLLNDASFTLMDDDGVAVDGAVTYTNLTATFTPDDALIAGMRYVATVTTAARDVAGNALVQDYAWEFTTAVVLDTSLPTVLATIPADDATGVALDADVVVTFSELMDPSTITTTTVTLMNGLEVVVGTVGIVGTTAVFDPGGALLSNTEYTASVTDLVADLAGNRMAETYTWTFTTGDPIAPVVAVTTPDDEATGLPVTATVGATFSEAMDPLTINDTTLVVTDPDGNEVAGTVTYDPSTHVATFVPDEDLEPGTTYTATITTGARDAAGNALANPYTWEFTTAPALDDIRPFVFGTIPADEAIDVFRDSDVTVTFSELMDPSTITTATFTLVDALGSVVGTIDMVGLIAVFSPSAPLEADTEYTASVSNLAADLAGNRLAETYTWTFTTGALLDPIPPTVTSTTPEDEAINVQLTTTVEAAFSEAMNPLTIDDTSFIVSDADGNDVLGTVMYDDLTSIATFVPDLDLEPDMTYTATITTDATDLAGVALEQDFTWVFSTGENVLIPPPINLRSLSTFVAVAGAGLTSSNSSGITTLGGDVGLSPTATCMSDGSICSLNNPLITGTLYANDPEGIAAKAKEDLVAAYVEATALPPGTTVNDLSGLVLAPGVYTSGSTMSVAVGGTVTLDGQGDPNAYWVFQIGSSLTVNNSAAIELINGANANNVFWAVFASSTIGSDVSFQGNVLAGASNSVGTDSVVIGRLLCTTGMITLLSNTITLPL